MGDHAQCKQTGEYFNSVGVVMAIIQVHRTPSLDVQIGGERVVMATRHWWKVAESESSDSEEDLPASAKALDGPEDGITRDSEGNDDETSDSALTCPKTACTNYPILTLQILIAISQD